MGIFGDKDKQKVVEKNGRKFLTKNGRRAGSLPVEAKKQAPTASNSLASSSAINEVILGTSEKPAHDYIPLSPGIAEFLATLKK